MNCQFDEIIDRRNTNSLKYDFAAERGKPTDVLPLWVADMDFKTSPFIIASLEKACHHGIFGYSESKSEYFNALKGWFCKYFDWDIQSEWLVKTPGVVFAICMAIRALSEEGDAVLIQRPVYYPFSQSVLDNGRKLVNSPLAYHEGKYSIDFADFEEKIIRNRVKVFILCNPHNPVGRVWKKEELQKLGDICVKHGVYIVSDEIHEDFVFDGHRHCVFANLKPEYLESTVTCTAPSKSFNLAGLQVSNIFIANGEIREKFQSEMNRAGYSQLNGLGLAACQSAYKNGREWLEELKKYLTENLVFIRNFISERLPQIKMVEPEGTYLVWLDFRGLGLENRQLENLIVNWAGLWLDGGSMFGPEGNGFERMNIACPRATLQKALLQLEQAVNSIPGSHS